MAKAIIEVTQQGYGDPTLATTHKARKWLAYSLPVRAVFLVGSSFPSAWRFVSVRLLSTFAVSGSGGVSLHIGGRFRFRRLWGIK